ncbi:MAG TPA: methyltransferase domain-containing protein [Alphaproteobacteria bacterium]|nr:methyltransferase domain-containing protein [Alphaproteobacteria bacterium]
MELTPEYIAIAEKDVNDLAKIRHHYWQSGRYKILSEFTKSGGKILSVGCGPKEPMITRATHAVDITPLSEQYLRGVGYKGLFTISSCTSLPYVELGKVKPFDIVVCSEVIEHLPTIEDVIQTFKEVARVGVKWIITTPNSAVILPKHQNSAHRQFFTLDSLKKIIPVNHQIYTSDHHIYVEGI